MAKRKPKTLPRVQRPPPWPVLRMFGLGVMAIVACLWALARPKRPWQFRPLPTPPPSGEIEVEMWDGG